MNVPLSTEGNDYYQNKENDGPIRLIRQANATQSTTQRIPSTASEW